MGIYIFLFCLVYIMSFYDVFTSDKLHKRSFFLIVFFISVFLGGLRFETGTDWEQYHSYFYFNTNIGEFLNSPYEEGYAIFNYIIKIMTENYNVFLLVMIGVVCYLKFKTIYNYSQFPLIALLLNFSFYTGEMFAVRQSIALAITAYSIRYIVKHDFKKFFLMVCVACLFHRTAIVFLPAFYIFHFNISVKKIMIIILLMPAIILCALQFNLFDMIGYVSMNNMYSAKLEFYQMMAERNFAFGTNIDTETKMLNSGIKKAFFFILFILVKCKVAEKDRYYNGFLNFSIFSNMIFLFFLSIPEIALRLVVYYNFFEIFLLSNLLFLTKKKILQIILLFLLGVVAFIRYYYGIYQFYDLFIPYRNVLF